MKHSDSLFLLIKSLTPAEKRHFTLEMSKYGGDKHYSRLFDAIEGQKAYDEKAIRKKFEGEPYLAYLPRVKIYLSEQIMKSLRNFHHKVSSNMQLNIFLSEVEILFRKELYDECFEVIKKAKNYAIKYEKRNYLLTIIDWEMTVATATNDMKQIEEVRKSRISEQEAVLTQSQEILELSKLYISLYYKLLVAGKVRSPQEMEAIEEIRKHPLTQNELKTGRAEQLRIIIKSSVAQWEGKTGEVYKWKKKLVEICESNPHLIEEQLNYYFHNLQLLVTSCIQTGRDEDALPMLEKLKDLCEQYPGEINFKYQLNLYESEIALYMNRGEFDKASKLVSAMVKFAGDRLTTLDPLEEMFYHACTYAVYFANGDYKKADLNLQKIINSPHQDIRTNFRNVARIFNLVLQYEQREFVHLGYVLRSTYRYLLKNKGMYKSETAIMDFFRKAYGTTTHSELMNALAELRIKLLELTNDPFEANFTTGFPFIEWIDSKLENKPLAEICRRKYILSQANNKAA